MKPGEREGSTGLRSVVLLTVIVLLTAAATALQIKLRGFEGPLSDNILIIILINANFLLLAAVIFMIGRSLWKLSVERRSKVLGARFRTRLVAAFVSLSFIPTILLFVIGSGMFTRSIERLFSLRLENALQDSAAVAQVYYDSLKAESLAFARRISDQMAGERMLERFDPPALKTYLERKAEEYGLGAVEFFPGGGSPPVQAVTRSFPARAFVAAGPELTSKAFAGLEASEVADLGRRGELIRSVAPLFSPEDGDAVGAVAVSYYVPNSLTSKLESIRGGYVEYRSAFKGKEPIKLAYRLGFLAVTLALLLAAIWVALRVAAGITVPISMLAQGTVEVARGNLNYRIRKTSGDEVGLLVDSFNQMTDDLRSSSERLRHEMAHRETILASIDAGVVAVDRAGRITAVNPAASRILGVRPEEALNRRYDEAFGFIDLGPVRDLFRRLEQGQGRAEEEVSLSVRGRALTLRIRVSALRDGADQLLGSLVTFDDVTELLRAKKAETWQDVARKIAHEVKNPLTPIKLSAERLRKKFAEQSPDFGAVFDESSRTIIQQVDGLKGLLDEFSEFARMPRPNPVPQQLGPVIESVVALYEGARKDVEFSVHLQPDLPELPLDQDQMKRVFINLFKNAVEVMEEGGRVEVTAQALPGGGKVRIEVADNGPGIRVEDVSRLFEPYFSRKQKGGGLGLAIVERVIADHNGRVYAEQNRPQGARFVIELPVSR